MNNFVKNTRFPCYRDLSNPFVNVATDHESQAAATGTTDGSIHKVAQGAAELRDCIADFLSFPEDWKSRVDRGIQRARDLLESVQDMNLKPLFSREANSVNFL